MHDKHVYQVGDKVLHGDFGEGLVVDVRGRLFYDILEVVFNLGVKRVTSIHPLLKPKPLVLEEAPPPRPRRKRRRTPAMDPAARDGAVPRPTPPRAEDMGPRTPARFGQHHRHAHRPDEAATNDAQSARTDLAANHPHGRAQAHRPRRRTSFRLEPIDGARPVTCARRTG